MGTSLYFFSFFIGFKNSVSFNSHHRITVKNNRVKSARNFNNFGFYNSLIVFYKVTIISRFEHIYNNFPFHQQSK